MKFHNKNFFRVHIIHNNINSIQKPFNFQGKIQIYAAVDDVGTITLEFTPSDTTQNVLVTDLSVFVCSEAPTTQSVPPTTLGGETTLTTFYMQTSMSFFLFLSAITYLFPNTTQHQLLEPNVTLKMQLTIPIPVSRPTLKLNLPHYL